MTQIDIVSSPLPIQKALADCTEGAKVSQLKAEEYLRLARAEADDTLYEACRSMHRFYSSMREFFLEEERMITDAVERGRHLSAVA
ncbi:hypothetical protein [Methylobacterium nigriterrae]|uniref:hypothetical protein n=1 Tax=Methylobacterium nigriterrae TaxID=3127512 RepID=UPI003013595B